MRRHPGTLLTVTVLGLALTGVSACGGQDAAGPAPGPASEPSSTAASSPSSSDAADPTPTEPGGRMTEGLSQPLVLVRTGGVGGLKDRLELRPDGTCTVTSGGRPPVTRQLSEGQLAAIVLALKSAHLEAAAGAPSTSPTEHRSDQFTYTLTAEGHTLTTTETTAPPPLRPLLQQLDALLSAPAPTS